MHAQLLWPAVRNLAIGTILAIGTEEAAECAVEHIGSAFDDEIHAESAGRLRDVLT